MSRSGAFQAVLDIRPHERTVAGLMFSYFFLVITSFWILKPIKKTLFLAFYGTGTFDVFGFELAAQNAEALAKVLNMVVALVAATVFGLLSRRFRRQQLTYIFTTFFIVLYGYFALALGSPSEFDVWSFYLFGDLFSTLMVATFFTFLNDSVSSDGAKRLYGVVGFGGVLGGVFGSTAVAVWISALPVEAWLAAAAAIGVAILGVAWGAARALKTSRDAQDDAAEATVQGQAQDTESPSGNPALAGARLVFKSNYLLAIVAVVGLYELVSTIVDYQFTTAVLHFLPDPAEQGQRFATIYAATNWLSMFVQFFLTSFVMRRFGMATALLILPCSLALAASGFLITPTLLMGSLLNPADNAFSYSINQSSKEALYVPTSVEEKYQAKAFIDMFVQRFAKAIGVGLSILVGTQVTGIDAVRMLSLLVLPIVGLWSYAAFFAGRKFNLLEQGESQDNANSTSI